MRWLLLLLIFIFSLLGGGIPFWFRNPKQKNISLLLIFTGAFLFGITLFHLIPDTFSGLGSLAGIFIFIGFFLQVFLQKWSHGLEHGHGINKETTHLSAVGVYSILVGLSVHAFMEGLPLGFDYGDSSTLPALSFGILLHKIPEAMTLMVMLIPLKFSYKKRIGILLSFSMVTPLAAFVTYLLNSGFPSLEKILLYILAIVTGAFLQISTTIFSESGTRIHQLNRAKIISMVLGFGLAGATLFLE